MGLNLLTTLARNLLTGGTPQQPATIQREAEQLPITRIADVNAILPTPSEQDLLKKQLQLHATVESGPVKPETAIPDDGIKIGISKETIQKVLTFLQPLLADFRGNLDRFLTKPLDQSLPEYLKKIEPLLGTVIPHIESYITTLSPTTQKILNPANTQATAATPA
jgi:hypothetical protein